MIADPGTDPPRIVAFDLALTASGVVLPDGHADTLKPPPKLKGGARLDWWLHSFNVILADHQPNRIHRFGPDVVGLDDNAVDALALWTLATNGELDKEPT